jgi:hypothetical protein
MSAQPVKKVVRRFARLRPKKVAISAFLGLVVGLVVVQLRGQAQTTDALPYSGGYLVTGNYVVGGVDFTETVNPPDPVTGLSTGTIGITGVPSEASIVGAYLYWEAITLSSDLGSAGVPCAADATKSCVKFRGQEIFLDDGEGVKTSSLPLTGNSATCWSSGTPLTITQFKADVLRFLPVRLDIDDKPTPKRLVNDADLIAHGQPLHTVELPTRNGNQVPESGGATLVIVYVEPSEPLRKIVFYDGIYIQPSLNDPMTQTLRGFYKSSATKSAKVTNILANGQPNNKERIFFNDGTNTQISAADPIVGGSASERGWSQNTSVTRDVSYDVSSLMTPGNNSSGGYGETATLTIDHDQGGSYDCLTWGAVIFSTAVADIDPNQDGGPLGDGLPDGLEDAAGGLLDPDGQALPDLNAMGASSSHRDLFVEVGAMQALPGTSYGSATAPYDSANDIDTVTDTAGHHHVPTPYVIKTLGDRFAEHGITLHVDVGDITAYHGLGVIQHTDWVDDYTLTDADSYLVPSSLARGGEIVTERACDAENEVCRFPDYPGTVGWKFGFQVVRDFPVRDDGTELTPAQLTNSDELGYFDWNNGTRRRRFDLKRRDLFHYVLYAHTLWKRKSPLPCLVDGQPAPYPEGSTTCTTDNPDFHVPSGTSGIADLPGGNAMVTLGRWDEFVGRPFVRAATTFHELGHNLALWHGGVPTIYGNKALSTATYTEPNCKPFPTTMSYLYQVHGLYDDNDDIHLNYSTIEQADLTEATEPADAQLLPQTTYRPAWYAPAGSTLATNLGVSAATRYCSGPKFDPSSPPAAMARVYTSLSADPIDWNGDLDWTNAALMDQDVNFDGKLSDTFYGFNDWMNVRLQQLGSGTGVALFAAADGTFTVSIGDDENAIGDDENAIGDDGNAIGDDLNAIGDDENAIGDDENAIGDDENAIGDDENAIGAPQELDDNSAKGLGRTAPYALKVCIIGEPGCVEVPPFDPQYHKRDTRWQPPSFGHVVTNEISRKRGNANSTYLYSVIGMSSTTSSVDTAQLPNLVEFTYRVRTEFDDETPHTFSGYSKAVTVTAVNDAPVANADSYTTTRNRALKIGTQEAGVLGNDTDVDSPSSFLRAVLVQGPSSGSLVLNANGTFAYTPQNGFTGQVTFTYKANNGTWTVDLPNVPMSPDSNIATVTITVTAK